MLDDYEKQTAMSPRRISAVICFNARKLVINFKYIQGGPRLEDPILQEVNPQFI